MFKELYPLAQSAPIALLIAAEGDELRVTVQQKETKKGKPLQLSILATPTELDENLPASIADAVEAVFAKVPVADQVKGQVARAAGPKEKGKASPTPKKTPAATAKKKNAAKPIKPTTAKPAAAETGKRPTKDDCIAELQALYKIHGNALNREKFLELATKTGRTFERLFGGWHKFVAAAGLQSTEQDPAAPARDDKTAELFSEAHAEITGDGSGTALPPLPDSAYPETACAISTTKVPDTWPFPARPEGEEQQAPSPAAPPAPRMRSVELEDGTKICSEIREPGIGEELHAGGRTYIVRTVGLDVILVEPKDPPAPPPIVRKIVDDEGEQRGTHEGEATIHQRLHLPDGIFAVVRVTDKAVFVEATHEEAAA